MHNMALKFSEHLFCQLFLSHTLKTSLQYLSIDNSAHWKDKSTQRAIDRSIEIRMIQKSLCQQSTQNNSNEWPSSTKIHGTYFRSDIFFFFFFSFATCNGVPTRSHDKVCWVMSSLSQILTFARGWKPLHVTPAWPLKNAKYSDP